MNNKFFLIFLMPVFLISCSSIAEPVETAPHSAPFSKGVNFSGWFETNSAQSISFTRYSQQNFIDVKSLGADVIRLPIRFHDMTSGAPDYVVDPLLFRFLDSAVDWAEKYSIYIIIDNHSFHPVNPTPEDIDKVLLPVWAQVAQRYRNRSEYVVYEILNEPHGISDSRWGEIQGMAINTIRRYDQRHKIIVGGTEYNSVYKLSALPVYSDPNLIYTFHYYDPFLFTHQGETWSGEVNLGTLAGVPFPYNSSRMPAVPAKLKGTWVEWMLKEDYEKASSLQKMLEPLEIAVAFSKERNVPVFCGEFGVLLNNSQNRDRVKWYEFVTEALDKRNISRTSWDYYGGFGVFNISGIGDFHSDLNTAVVRALGFTPPKQVRKTRTIFDDGMVFFDDYPNNAFETYSWGDEMDFSYFDSNAADGEFAIRWGNAGLYNAFGFRFSGGGNFKKLVAADYYLEFKARTNRPVRFDVRFIDFENSNTIPWRIKYLIDENVLAPDGVWHTIRIPLKSMTEHGAWVSATEQWLSPKGEFKWDQIDRLEFAAEHTEMRGINIYFDSIKVTR